MFTQLLKFESAYLTKQPSFVIMLLTFLGYGMLINADSLGQGMELLNVNSPYRLSFFIALTSILATFAAMLFCVNSLLKDHEHNFNGIVGMLSIKPRLLSRATAVVISTITVVSFLSVGLMLGMFSPTIEPEKVADGFFTHYLWPWFVFVLPNTLIVCCLMVAIILRKQSAFSAYITGVLMFLLFWSAMLSIGAPITGNPIIKDPGVVSFFAIVDPFGTTAFFEQTQFWTPSEKNQQMIELSGSLLLNRALWLTISVGLFVLAVQCKGHASPLGSEGKNSKTTASKRISDDIASNQLLGTQQENVGFTVFCAEIHNFGIRFQLQSWLSMSAFEIKQLLTQWPFRVFSLVVTSMGFIGMLMAVGTFQTSDFPGANPTTSTLLSYSFEAFFPLVCALIIFYSAEKIWHEKQLKTSCFINCTPVANVAIYGAKLLSLLFIPMFLIALNIVLSLMFQIANDFYRFDLTLYFSQFYLVGSPIVIQAVLIFFIQSLVANSRFANKYLAMVISAIVVVFFTKFIGMMGINHPLININQLPDLSRIHSDMVGYGEFFNKFSYLAALWGSLAVVISALTILNWKREEWTDNTKVMNKGFFKGVTQTNLLYLIMPVTLFLVAVVVVQLSLPAHNDYQSHTESLENRALYERKYSQYQSLINPQVSHMSVELDFFPSDGRHELRANYKLSNTSNTAINEVFVTSRSQLNDFEIDGTEVVFTDSTSNWQVYLLKFTKPFLPGSSIEMTYSLEQSSEAFSINRDIVNNGSYLNQAKLEPVLGYVDAIEISDKYQRQARGLAARPKQPPDRNRPIKLGKFIEYKRSFEAVLSTSGVQSAVTSGKLIKQWQDNGRNYFHYKATKPIYPVVGYFSAEYHKRSITHQGIAVDMYFHPAHSQNIDEMLKATRATLDYGIEHFGEYAFEHLRILEVPAYHPFGGKASAGVVALSEGLYIEKYDELGVINNTARNTIHEIVHQWWGEKLVPKITQGEGVLLESVTKYIEAVVLEKMYGKAMARKLAQYTQRRYFSGRSYTASPEVGMIDANEEGYLNYGKGPIVLLALRELLGERELNAALKQLIESHHEAFTAKTDDLLDAIYRISTNSQQALIQDWLTKVIDYELLIDDAVVKPLEDGRFEVVINIQARRFETDIEGNRNQIKINEPIIIGLYDGHLNYARSSTIYIGGHQINQSHSTITLTVVSKPKYVAIDPAMTRLDRNLTDNTLILETHQ